MVPWLRSGLAVVVVLAVAHAAAWWFSERNVYLRFTREAGVSRGTAFENDFVPTEPLMSFVRGRGHDDPRTYFEEAVGLTPGVVRLADVAQQPSERDAILARGADTLIVYSITRGFLLAEVETRILMYLKDGEIVEMTSRTWGTTF